jgi:hypothetical protein
MYNNIMILITNILFILALLQVKHWYIDFVNQDAEEVAHKGIYLDWLGIKHSLKHGIGTFIVFFVFTDFLIALVIGVVDAVLHYHIDWAKMNWGNRDITTPQFWNHLGLDQMAHQLSYILYIFILIGI